MRFNWARLRYRAMLALSRRKLSLENVEARVWTVHPASRAHCRPALYPDGALERIRGLSPFRDWEKERPLIQGGEVILPPTTGHLLKSVDVVEGHLFCGGFEWVAGVGDSPWWLPPRKRERWLKRATLASTDTGAAFFGCLLLDDFPLALLGEDPAHNIDLPAKPSGHEADYRSLLGLPARREVHRTHIGQLTLFVDPAWNGSKAERYRRLRRTLRANLAPTDAAPRVYIRRGMSGQRRVMSNEAELEAVLTERGFTVIDPMRLSAREVAQGMLNARMVISIEGSQISHAQYAMADDAALIVLQPPDRFAMQYKEFTDAMDMRFGFVVCRPEEGEEGGFKVDIGELLGLIDRMDA